MRFKSATIKDFKRFTHLTVQEIPETARLIMLAGLMDAVSPPFMTLCIYGTRLMSLRPIRWDEDYFRKTGSYVQVQHQRPEDIQVNFYDREPATVEEKKKLFYFRICI